MLTALLFGTVTTMFCLAIQIWVALLLLRRVKSKFLANHDDSSVGQEFRAVSMVMLGLFLGHMFQIAIWARLFMWVGEFTDFSTAFYHSAVNFATLGYGDIVMSETWRLLGALEAGSGVFMFGLSTASMLAVITHLYTSRKLPAIKEN